MISKGDGSFEKKINEGRCPSCSCALYVEENRLDCAVCGLSIINVEKSGDYLLITNADDDIQ